jgi:hypothetical protein
MKRSISCYGCCASLTFLCALLLGACAPLPAQSDAQSDAASAAPAFDATGDQVVIERVPFVLGVSSATVERMALRAACTGGAGAGRVTPPGPVEVYRMACDNGNTFMARCELRQCKKM